MKASIKAQLALILVFSLLFTACGKYEEGPSFSLRSKTNRVVNTWKIERMIVDDKDVTDASPTYVDTYRIEFTKDDRVIEQYTSSAGNHKHHGTWSFEDSYANLVIKISGSVSSYRILRLTADEMWLEIMKDGVWHETRFESAD